MFNYKFTSVNVFQLMTTMSYVYYINAAATVRRSTSVSQPAEDEIVACSDNGFTGTCTTYKVGDTIEQLFDFKSVWVGNNATVSIPVDYYYGPNGTGTNGLTTINLMPFAGDSGVGKYDKCDYAFWDFMASGGDYTSYYAQVLAYDPSSETGYYVQFEGYDGMSGVENSYAAYLNTTNTTQNGTFISYKKSDSTNKFALE
eukprot:Pgem_evm1s15607